MARSSLCGAVALLVTVLVPASAARGGTVACGGGGCPEIIVGSTSGMKGDTVGVAVTLHTHGNAVSGAAVFILYSAADFGSPLPSCTVGPTIAGLGKSFSTNNSAVSGQLSFNVFGAPATAIPDATVLANCSFTIGAGASSGPLVNDQPQTADTTPADYASTTATNGMITVLPGPLDVDSNGMVDAATDVVYTARYLLNLPPVPASFRSLDPTIPPDEEIAARIDDLGTSLDVDDDGAVGVATDLVYVARHLLDMSPVPQSFRDLDPTIPPDSEIIPRIELLL
jgi:hypothetical protein